MFSDRPFRDAKKRKKNWIELKKHQNLLNRVDELEMKLSAMDQDIEEMQDTVDEVSRMQGHRIYDTQGNIPPPAEEG